MNEPKANRRGNKDKLPHCSHFHGAACSFPGDSTAKACWLSTAARVLGEHANSLKPHVHSRLAEGYVL